MLMRRSHRRCLCDAREVGLHEPPCRDGIIGLRDPTREDKPNTKIEVAFAQVGIQFLVFF